MSESVYNTNEIGEVEELQFESPFDTPDIDNDPGEPNKTDKIIEIENNFAGFNRLYTDLSTENLTTFKPEIEWLREDAIMGIGCLYHSWSAHINEYEFDKKSIRDLKCALIESFCILEEKASAKTDQETSSLKSIMSLKDGSEKNEYEVEKKIEDIKKLHDIEENLLDCCNTLLYEYFLDEDIRLPWRGSYFPENKGAIIEADDLYAALDLDGHAKNYDYRILVGGGMNINKGTMQQYLGKLVEKHGDRNLVVAHTNLTEAEQVCSKLLKQLHIREEIVTIQNKNLNPIDEQEKRVIENQNKQRAQYETLSASPTLSKEEKKEILEYVEHQIIANGKHIEDPKDRQIYAKETFLEQYQDLVEKRTLRKLLTADYVNTINEAFKKPIDGIILWDQERQGEHSRDDIKIYSDGDDSSPKYISSAPGAIIIHRALQFNYGDRIWTPAIAKEKDRKPFWETRSPNLPIEQKIKFKVSNSLKSNNSINETDKPVTEQSSKTLQEQIKELRIRQKIIIREGTQGLARVASNQIFQRDTMLEQKFNQFMWWLTKRVHNLAEYTNNKTQEKSLYAQETEAGQQINLEKYDEDVELDIVDAADIDDNEAYDIHEEPTTPTATTLSSAEKMNHLLNELKETYQMKTGHVFKLPYQSPAGTLVQGIPVLLASRTIPDKENH